MAASLRLAQHLCFPANGVKFRETEPCLLVVDVGGPLVAGEVEGRAAVLLQVEGGVGPPLAGVALVLLGIAWVLFRPVGMTWQKPVVFKTCTMFHYMF